MRSTRVLGIGAAVLLMLLTACAKPNSGMSKASPASATPPSSTTSATAVPASSSSRSSQAQPASTVSAAGLYYVEIQKEHNVAFQAFSKVFEVRPSQRDFAATRSRAADLLAADKKFARSLRQYSWPADVRLFAQDLAAAIDTAAPYLEAISLAHTEAEIDVAQNADASKAPGPFAAELRKGLNLPPPDHRGSEWYKA